MRSIDELTLRSKSWWVCFASVTGHWFFISLSTSPYLGIPKRNLQRSTITHRSKNRQLAKKTISVHHSIGNRFTWRFISFDTNVKYSLIRSIDLLTNRERKQKISSDYTPKTARSVTIRWTEHSVQSGSTVTERFVLALEYLSSWRYRMAYVSNSLYIGSYTLGQVRERVSSAFKLSVLVDGIESEQSDFLRRAIAKFDERQQYFTSCVITVGDFHSIDLHSTRFASTSNGIIAISSVYCPWKWPSRFWTV